VTRIGNEARGINRVVHDHTSKPPEKIEWERRDWTMRGMVHKASLGSRQSAGLPDRSLRIEHPADARPSLTQRTSGSDQSSGVTTGAKLACTSFHWPPIFA